MPVYFHFEDTPPFEIDQEDTIAWLSSCVVREQFTLDTLNIIFCSDDYLLEINKKYLDHHDLTDIITFDHSESGRELQGDLFISADRVRENAAEYQVSFLTEMDRVIIHGILHLMGYRDKTDKDRMVMKDKENLYLSLR